MPTYAELKTRAETSRRRIHAVEKARICVLIDTSSIASGALETLDAIRAEIDRRGLDVTVDEAGGNGLSFADPVVEYDVRGGPRLLYQKVGAGIVPAFLDALFGRNDLENDWLLGALAGVPNEFQQMDDHPWWSGQVRRLSQDMGIANPAKIDDFIARGAYSGLERALGMGQEEVIAEVLASRLRGRSGSDFPTGRKWDFLRTSTTNPKAMVCNADEGDPGAWVNRMTLENDPHALIEGMIIGAWATGASRGYIYIREEYPLAHDRVRHAVLQAREKGVLGPDVLGRGFSFDIDVVRGAGSYVCGEESGLIASIEDGRGMPKIRPPFPAASGVFGQGSNVNNVETYHSVAWLLRNGVEKYLEIDTGRNAGTMLFSLSGHVQRAGCFELAVGTRVRDVFEIYGGGAEPGHSFKALQPGGPLLGVMPEWSLDVPLEPEEFREKKMAAMGGGGLVFLDERDCIVDLCAQFEWFLEDESCGRCTTCHGGTQRMVEILRRIQRGGGRESDIGKLRLLAATLRYSNCVHGQAAPSIIVNTLDWFMDEVMEHILERRCRARACHGLIRYEVDPASAIVRGLDGALAKAADYCPTAAVRHGADQAGVEGTYTIEDSLCIRCGACKDIAPNAIRIVDYYESGIGPAPELISIQPAER